MGTEDMDWTRRLGFFTFEVNYMYRLLDLVGFEEIFTENTWFVHLIPFTILNPGLYYFTECLYGCQNKTHHIVL